MPKAQHFVRIVGAVFPLQHDMVGEVPIVYTVPLVHKAMGFFQGGKRSRPPRVRFTTLIVTCKRDEANDQVRNYDN